jgi:hypothetical protein
LFHNFQEVDWERFKDELKKQLGVLDLPMVINNQDQLDNCCQCLMEAIQKTIENEVPKTKIMPKSKRWWTKELTTL